MLLAFCFFFPSVGYEAKSLSFGNKLHDLSIFEKKNYQSIVTKINYMIRGWPKKLQVLANKLHDLKMT